MNSPCMTIHRPSISRASRQRRLEARARREGWRTAEEVRAMLREIGRMLRVAREANAAVRKSPALCLERQLALCCD